MTIYAAGNSGVGTRTRALDQVGDRFSPGWCLYWCLTRVFKAPGLGDYDHDGSADAEDYWKAAVARGVVVKEADLTKAPPGVMLMWVGGSGDHGHAAYALGKGEMVSTDLPRRGYIGRCSVKLPHDQWGLKPVGWVIKDGNGITLPPPAVKYAKPTPLPAPVKYRVTAEAGLRGHKVPDTSSPTVWLAKYGTTFDAVATNTGDGHDWAVNKNGTHYAMDYLEVYKP